MFAAHAKPLRTGLSRPNCASTIICILAFYLEMSNRRFWQNNGMNGAHPFFLYPKVTLLASGKSILPAPLLVLAGWYAWYPYLVSWVGIFMQPFEVTRLVTIAVTAMVQAWLNAAM